MQHQKAICRNNANYRAFHSKTTVSEARKMYKRLNMIPAFKESHWAEVVKDFIDFIFSTTSMNKILHKDERIKRILYLKEFNLCEFDTVWNEVFLMTRRDDRTKYFLISDFSSLCRSEFAYSVQIGFYYSGPYLRVNNNGTYSLRAMHSAALLPWDLWLTYSHDQQFQGLRYKFEKLSLK